MQDRKLVKDTMVIRNSNCGCSNFLVSLRAGISKKLNKTGMKEKKSRRKETESIMEWLQKYLIYTFTYLFAIL